MPKRSDQTTTLQAVINAVQKHVSNSAQREAIYHDLVETLEAGERDKALDEIRSIDASFDAALDKLHPEAPVERAEAVRKTREAAQAKAARETRQAQPAKPAPARQPEPPKKPTR